MNKGNVDLAGLAESGHAVSRPLADAAADRRFLRAISIDLTGRTPLAAEWKAALGKTRHQVIQEQAGGLQFWKGFYDEQLFYLLLIDNFRPSTPTFEELPRRLQQRRISVRDAVRLIVSSQFFNARNPGNDTFVTVVLEQLLGITVQKKVRTLEAGKRMYDGLPATFLGRKGSNQADLVRITVEDEGFERFLLSRQFEAIFHAPLPRKRLALDAVRLREKPQEFPEIVADWLMTRAYEERLEEPREKTDRVFVRSLFVDLLGREPSYQEFRRSRNALLALSDSAPLRSVLIKLMLDSDAVELPATDLQHAETLVTKLLLRFLCREPTRQEMMAFVAELQRPECTTKTLVRALLTHWEYHHY